MPSDGALYSALRMLCDGPSLSRTVPVARSFLSADQGKGGQGFHLGKQCPAQSSSVKPSAVLQNLNERNALGTEVARKCTHFKNLTLLIDLNNVLALL